MVCWHSLSWKTVCTSNGEAIWQLTAAVTVWTQASHQCSRWRSMVEFKLMSVSSRNSVLKMLGPLGGGTLNVVAELDGVRSSHSIVSHGVSLKAMLTIPSTSGTEVTLVLTGDRGVSMRSLLVKSLSCWWCWCEWWRWPLCTLLYSSLSLFPSSSCPLSSADIFRRDTTSPPRLCGLPSRVSRWLSVIGLAKGS